MKPFIVFYYIDFLGGWQQTHQGFDTLEEAMLFMESVMEKYRPMPDLYQRMG